MKKERSAEFDALIEEALCTDTDYMGGGEEEVSEKLMRRIDEEIQRKTADGNKKG